VNQWKRLQSDQLATPGDGGGRAGIGALVLTDDGLPECASSLAFIIIHSLHVQVQVVSPLIGHSFIHSFTQSHHPDDHADRW
jgi:hypothetical protein